MIALVAALGTFSTSCAYILHPERRNSGRTSGRIDTVPLILDILWFIPGIIPGVVALIVDFTTGAIYVDNGSVNPVKAKGRIAVNVPPVNQTTRMSLRLLTRDGRVVDQATALVRPGDEARKLIVDAEKGQRIAQKLGDDSRRLQLEVTGLGNDVRVPVIVQ